MNDNTDRRSFLAAAPVAAVALAVPVAAVASDPIPEYLAAFHAYDDDDRLSAERLARAGKVMREWEPPTAHDMLRKIVAMLDDYGSVPASSQQALIRQVEQLIR